jgi:N-acetylglucosaminyl-diphospho-decaprenol L-rhamnosyltransferase
MKLDIIIVNWNSKEYLLNCLQSLEKIYHKNLCTYNIIVIDNNSSDNSCDDIQSLSTPIKLIKNERNIGFAAACNQGARIGTGEYILFLNPDTLLFDNSLLIPFEFMNNALKSGTSKIGICGIQLIDDYKKVSPSCSRFPSPARILATMLGLRLLFPCIKKELMDDWDHSSSMTVDQIKGAFFFVSRKLFNDLSGFDERFFVYYEEVDFSYRAKSAGWDSFFLASAQIYHRGCGTTDSIKGKALFYFLRSRILYIHKHFSLIESVFHVLGTLTLEFFARLMRALFSQSRSEELKSILEAYTLLYKWFFFRVNHS